MEKVYLTDDKAYKLLKEALKGKTTARLSLYILRDGLNVDFIYPPGTSTEYVAKDLNNAGIDIDKDTVSNLLENVCDEKVIEIDGGDLYSFFGDAIGKKVIDYGFMCPDGDETMEELLEYYDQDDIDEIDNNSPNWREDADEAKRIVLYF